MTTFETTGRAPGVYIQEVATPGPIPGVANERWPRSWVPRPTAHSTSAHDVLQLDGVRPAVRQAWRGPTRRRWARPTSPTLCGGTSRTAGATACSCAPPAPRRGAADQRGVRARDRHPPAGRRSDAGLLPGQGRRPRDPGLSARPLRDMEDRFALLDPPALHDSDLATDVTARLLAFRKGTDSVGGTRLRRWLRRHVLPLARAVGLRWIRSRAAVRPRGRHVRARRQRARRPQGARQRGPARGPGRGGGPDRRRAGPAQRCRHQRDPAPSSDAASSSGAPGRSRRRDAMALRQRAPPPAVHRGIAAGRHPVRGVRAEQPAALADRQAPGHRLPHPRLAERRAVRRDARRGVPRLASTTS